MPLMADTRRTANGNKKGITIDKTTKVAEEATVAAVEEAVVTTITTTITTMVEEVMTW